MQDERDMIAFERKQILTRMVQGAKASDAGLREVAEETIDSDSDEDEFMKAYRQQRLVGRNSR